MSQQTPIKYTLDLDHDLDRSIEQQQDNSSGYRRDSGIGGFEFENDQHEEHHFNELGGSQLMRSSQCSEDGEGVFSYSEDYRMRQSARSDEQCELEDIGGNADMSDRRVPGRETTVISTNKSTHDNHQSSSSQLNSIKIVQKYQPHYGQNSDEYEYGYVGNKNDSSYGEVQTQEFTLESIPTEIGQEIQIMEKKQVVAELQITKQENEVGVSQQRSQERMQVLGKVEEEQRQVVVGDKKKQDQQIYENNQVKIQQKLFQQEVKKQQPPQKPKITLQRQVLSEDQPKPSTSSIRDLFRPSTITSQPINYQPPKQYNPIPNQLPSPIKQPTPIAPNRTTTKPTTSKNNNIPYPQPANQELGMLMKICIQRKKQNYSMLREWDNKRMSTMTLHLNLIQTLQCQIDKRIKSSSQNFQIYSNFFRQKLKQQQKFATSPVLNTKYALQNNSISKNIYINCSVILNSLSQENQLKIKKVQDFIGVLRNDVLKELIDAHLVDSDIGQRELLKVREKISTLKNTLKKCKQETQDKWEQLAKMYTQGVIRPSCDIYTTQLQFLRNANQHLFIQKRLGQNTLQYYHSALNQQFKRAKVIRQALLTYSKALKSTYHIHLEQIGLEQLSKTEQIKLIEEFYSLEGMLEEEVGVVIKKMYGVKGDEDVGIGQVAKYIQTFECEQFDNRMLILKQFPAKYYPTATTSKQPSKSARQQPCTVVITIDFYLHLFFSPDKSSLKPDLTLKITPKQLQIKPQKQQFVDIIKKEQKKPSMMSYFWESKNQRVYKVRFPSRDSKQLFYDYVSKLLV